MTMRRILLSLTLAVAVQMPDAALTQTAENAEIAPTGKLRVGMNSANTTLVTRTPDGRVAGISVDLATFIAGKLGVPYEPVLYPGSEAYTASFGQGAWDLIVTGRNAFAATMVDFSADVILIEFLFVAAPGRQFADASHVDRAGIRIGVARNASADEYLGRTLTSAELVRTAGDIAAGIDLLRNNKADMYATVTDTAIAMADRLPGARIIPGVFNTVGFAVAMPKGRSSVAKGRLAQIVSEAKAAGILQRAIDSSGLRGVRVAPD